MVQRAGASQFAQRPIERYRRLAPVAALCFRHFEHGVVRARLNGGGCDCHQGFLTSANLSCYFRFPSVSECNKHFPGYEIHYPYRPRLIQNLGKYPGMGKNFLV